MFDYLKKALIKGFLSIQHPDLAWKVLCYEISKIIADIRYRFGYYNYPYRIIFLAGMAMSATTWMKNLLAGIPGVYTRYTPIPYEIGYNLGICDSAFKYVPEHGNTLLKTHIAPTSENIDCISRNGVEKVVVTYRDLRDVALSRYHRLVRYPKRKDAFDFVDYRALGMEEALSHSIQLVADKYVPWIRGWYEVAEQYPGTYLLVKFEELKMDTKGTFKKVLDFYGIKLSDNKIDEIVESAKGKGNVKKNKSKAKVLPLGISSNFRKGEVGSWREEMSDTHKIKCKELLGPILIELGYEKDLNW